MQAIIEDIDALKAIYDKIQMTASDKVTTSTDKDNVTTIESSSSFKITREVFNELKEKVKVIRSNYIS